ncbi:hypothetical protein CTI12_AA370510 [Artemisia annua]|uniref:Uncharacterized protein n=1 Tax=Artemisia annua TaxID=35608 RepID=A0A2U1MKD1_ARTAN|nr:hypothetical protein CTI12_AA370510 [Artemisia annua]
MDLSGICDYSGFIRCTGSVTTSLAGYKLFFRCTGVSGVPESGAVYPVYRNLLLLGLRCTGFWVDLFAGTPDKSRVHRIHRRYIAASSSMAQRKNDG